MPKFVFGMSAHDNLRQNIRKFRLYSILTCIAKESSNFFENIGNENESFGISNVQFELFQPRTGKRFPQDAIITLWDLIDLAYHAILYTNDYRGEECTSNETLYLFLGLQNETRDEHFKRFESSSFPGELLVEFYGFAGEQLKVQHAAEAFRCANREQYILNEIVKKVKNGIDIRKTVYEEIGVQLEIVHALLLRFFYESVRSPFVDDWKREITRNEELQTDDINRVINYFQCSYKQVRGTPLKRQYLYTKPIITTDNHMQIACNSYLMLSLYEHGIYWLVRNYYQKKGDSAFVNFFGTLFEQYFSELLQTYLSSKQYQRVEAQATPQADWRLVIDEIKILVEQKAGIMRLNVKQQLSEVDDYAGFLRNNVIKAMQQLCSTEQTYADGTYIKVILLYDDYINPAVLDYVFNLPECCVSNDANYWIVTIDEMEMLLHTYKSNSGVFKSIINEKVELEKEKSRNGRSIRQLLQKHKIYDNEHLKQEVFTKYQSEAVRSTLCDNITLEQRTPI